VKPNVMIAINHTRMKNEMRNHMLKQKNNCYNTQECPG
jgi:hypothetical protein